MTATPELGEIVDQRSEVLFRDHRQSIYCRTDRLFGWLMLVEWLAAMAAAFWIAPRSWIGLSSRVHLHVWTAILLGGAITLVPVWLARFRPGEPSTRYAIATAQMLMSALLVHLTGGRIETHFHVFGSLAILAIYRDWKVFVPATLVVTVDHLVRGMFWPQSVFGVLTASPWRPLEHAGWVVFEVLFLVRSCLQSLDEMRDIARQRAQLEATNEIVEGKVLERTAQLEREMAERKLLEAQLMQAHKLESIGQLAAGIAHEINTPIQYVGDNSRFIEDSFAAMDGVLAAYAKFVAEARASGVLIEEAEALKVAAEDADLEYLLEEIPKAIAQCREGIDRVTHIVRAMKEFSHPGTSEKEFVDINHAIENTLAVCRNEWKYVAEVRTELDSALPPVRCFPVEFNQVILNLVVNAAQAIGDANKNSDTLGTIRLCTRSRGDSVEIRISDNGPGIPEAVRARIFTPFFTTKEVGKGTGQGLCLARTAIVKKHGGSICFETEENVGTTFIVTLPVNNTGLEEAA